MKPSPPNVILVGEGNFNYLSHHHNLFAVFVLVPVNTSQYHVMRNGFLNGFCYTMSLYLLVLAASPCCLDGGEFEYLQTRLDVPTQIASLYSNSDSTSNHSEHAPCSPVSPCHCCVGFEVIAFQMPMILLPVAQLSKVFAPTKSIFSLTGSDVWQPPRF